MRQFTNQNAQRQAQVAHTGRQEVIDERLFHGHAGVQQNGKVTCPDSKQSTLQQIHTRVHVYGPYCGLSTV